MANEIRVLIAEDSSQIRMMVKTMLEIDGRFDVVGEATDGAEAVELTAKLLPDVVVLDLGMPVMDGLEALPQIRSAHPAVKIVILSGFPRRRSRRRPASRRRPVRREGLPLDSLGRQLHSVARASNS